MALLETLGEVAEFIEEILTGPRVVRLGLEDSRHFAKYAVEARSLLARKRLSGGEPPDRQDSRLT